ncbi:MAG TPA: Gfo/Idh/MocA family oxidoreductase [Thermoanaerobaculia bacterium]|nr:Gfo/Idh/MocA family oxidoreductase [Thermoanaerobaculia bacterium]
MEGSGIDVALAGCGRWGTRILADLVALGARVRVGDPSEGARRAAIEAGAAEAAPGLDALGAVDAVIVATPTLRHAETIESAVRRGTPIFCEKPLTADPDSAHRLAQALDGRLWVLEKWRWHPAVEAIGAFAREEPLGTVRALRTRRLQPSIAGYDVDPVWVLAPHELSIATEILGGLPAIARARAEFEAGSVVGLTGESDAPGAWSFEVSVRAAERRREIELVCSQGTARWTSADEHAVRIEDERIPVDPEPPLRRELRAALKFLRGGPPPKGSARESAAAVAALAAARRLAGVTPAGRPSR